MNIYLNAQLISDQEGYRSAGVSNYARQLLLALGQARAAGRIDHRLVAFVNARSLTVPGVELVRTRLPLDRPLARIGWEQTLLPAQLLGQGPGLVHGLVNVLPLATRLPGVVTVHDLSFVRTPEVLPPLKRAYLTQLCAASVRRARRVIAVSRQTADDLVACFDVAQEKVRVVPNGVSAEFQPGEAAAIARFRRSKGLPDRFVLYVGTLEPRKNVDGLVRAYARWRQAHPEQGDVKLVLGGGKGWYYDAIFRTVADAGLADHVLFPGFIPAAELPQWYQAADLFVYPSQFEGFGLPVLEAMACGAPVICSRTGSLLEVAGDAALTVLPGDETTLAAAITLLLSQPALAAELTRRGLRQAQRFSWRRCAQQTLAVYDEAARLGPA